MEMWKSGKECTDLFLISKLTTPNLISNPAFANNKKSQAPATHCTHKSSLPLLPSGPGGVGENALRETDT